MERFDLTVDLLTGNTDIDEHHRILLDLANEVVDPSAIESDSALFGKALAILARYVVYHFAAEEYLMEQSAYPHETHHRQWHDRFRDEVASYVARAYQDGLSRELRLKVSFAIETWFMEHIRITDRDFARFLQQQGGAADVRLPDTQILKTAGKLPVNFEDDWS